MICLFQASPSSHNTSHSAMMSRASGRLLSCSNVGFNKLASADNSELVAPTDAKVSIDTFVQ
jgi:hypothetical protein